MYLGYIWIGLVNYLSGDGEGKVGIKGDFQVF